MKGPPTHPLMDDIYGQLMNGVHELAPNADAVVGFALVAWDANGNLMAFSKRSGDVPFASHQILDVVTAALVNRRHLEALN